MNATEEQVQATEIRSVLRKRRGVFFSDLAAVSSRALRSTKRDIELLLPALVIPVFFFVVNIGAFQDVAENIPGLDYKAFQLPVAIIFAVTGISRAITLVFDIQGGYFDRLSLTPVNRLALLLGLMVAENIPGLDYKAFQLPVAIIFAVTGISRAITLVFDIQGGYFDRLSLTPVNRLALLLGLMVADFTLVIALSIPVVIMGFVVGVRFESGVLGILAFILIAGAWSLAFAGFLYAIALKTGSPTAVNTSWLVFFPFLFLTTTFLPRESLTGWMSTIATYNPVTYLLEALRSLVSEGWDIDALFFGFLSIAAVTAVSLTLALLALRGRVRRS